MFLVLWVSCCDGWGDVIDVLEITGVFMRGVLWFLEVDAFGLPYSILALAVARVFRCLGRGVRGSFRLWLSLSISIASGGGLCFLVWSLWGDGWVMVGVP